MHANRAAVDFTRLSLSGGIDKHGAAAMAERLGKLGRKLMTGNDPDALAGKCLGKQSAGVPAKAVVAPQRVTISYD
ncbi:MAG: hypothetical protein ABSF71_04675 [Terriglobia bacterium]